MKPALSRTTFRRLQPQHQPAGFQPVVVQMEVAGHYSRLVASRDEYAINQAISQICMALESDAPFQSTVNISGSTIISDSELEGVTISNSLGK